MADGAASQLNSGPGRWIRLARAGSVWLVLALIVALAAATLENFLSTTNLLNILRQVSIIGLIAIGMTIVLMAGHFDLSVGALLSLAAVLALKMQPVDGSGTLLAVVVPIAVALLVGAFTGFLVGSLGANSIVVTVGMQLVLGGATLLLVAGQHVRVDGAAPAFMAIGGGQLAGIPNPVLILLAAVAAMHVLMTRTQFGRQVRALGGSAEAALLVGVPIARRVMTTFIISAALAAIAGIVLASRVRNLDPTATVGYELAALTGAVLGGTRLTGGQGSVLKTLAGVLILGVVANAMRLLDLSYNVQLLMQGLVLVTAVALDQRTRGSGR